MRELLRQKAKWLNLVDAGDIMPYVYVRPENKILNPGSRHSSQWFPWSPLLINPLDLKDLEFAERIYHLENTAFGPAAMAIPRWVFYDCAVMPGFVAGFAMKTSKLPAAIRKVLNPKGDYEWTPLSLFIIIPTMKKGEWVAHNLCAVNSLLPASDRLYALGFLSKAFGLWYANVEACCGMTQWGNSALKLHSHYGHLQILTSYTPVHTHANTITYRTEVNLNHWELFFTREVDYNFLEKYEPTGLLIDPKVEHSLIDLQLRLQNGEGPFFLGASDLADQKNLTDPLVVYRAKQR
jgi:hypothetical protein